MKFISVVFSLMICFIGAYGANHALLVGIGKYDTAKTGWTEIHGDQDIPLIKKELLNNNFEKANIITLINHEATKEAIIRELKRLAQKCKQGDTVLFHFSGHGQPVVDINGDEKDRFDESIIPYDAYKTTKYKIGSSFYNGENHLTDDELHPLLNEIKKKVGPKGYLLVTVDACFSRGIEMAAMEEFSNEDIRKIGRIRGTSDRFKIDIHRPYNSVSKPKGFSKGAKMVVITACREDERNFQYKIPDSDLQYGSLSYTVYLLLRRKEKFSKWENYFQKNLYQKDRIFCRDQHPKITIYY